MAVKRISDFDISKRGLLSGIYGNTRNSEFFIDKDLCRYNITKELFLYLKEEHYRVVFYNPTLNIGFYSYSEDDLAVFCGLKQPTEPIDGDTTTTPSNPHDGQMGNGKYVRNGDDTSYVPKINTPFGKLKPRFGPRNQTSSSSHTTVTSIPSQAAYSRRTNILQLGCHYPQFYLHNKGGSNTFFKRQSSLNVFEEIFGYSYNHPSEKMAVIFEMPENIKPPKPGDVESQFNNLIADYEVENRQLKMIVLFGYASFAGLAGAYRKRDEDTECIFFRSTFATFFGLGALNEQNDEERKRNLEIFERNMFCVDLPQEEEVANWLIRKRIIGGLKCTLSPRPFETLVRSITMGNFKIPNNKGEFVFASTNDRLVKNLESSHLDTEKLIGTISADDAEKQLRKMKGMEKVVEQIENLMNLILQSKQMKETTGESLEVYLHMVFMGNPGTGKTTVARLVAQWFREKNVLSKGTFIDAKVGDLVGQFVGETRIKAQDLCERALGGVLFIDEAYGLCEEKGEHGTNYNAEAIEVLIQYMTKPDFMLIMAGYKNQMEELLTKSNQGMKSRISNDQMIMFDDYEPPVLMDILNSRLFHPKTDAFNQSVRMLVEVMYAQRDLEKWGNAREMVQLAAKIYKRYFRKNDGVLDVCHIPEDCKKLISTEMKSEAEVLQGLDELIGLENVKKTITEIYRDLFRNQIRRRDGLSVEQEPLTFIFKGAPGTGKTTVARMLGGILHNLGLLASEDLLEKKKGDIINSLVGGPEQNINQLFASSVGKTLFIDEAYSLCENGSGVIDTMVGLMTDIRYLGKMALVLAGYSDDMEKFLNVNSGMSSRFSYIIDFDNYTNEELWQILQLNVRRLQCHFSDEEQCRLLAISWFSTLTRNRKFGNAREVRKLRKLLEKNNDERLRRNNIAIDSNSMNEYWPEDFPEEAHQALAKTKAENVDSTHTTTTTVTTTTTASDTTPSISDAGAGNVINPSSLVINPSGEDEARKATCVEHLEHSVGLLKCTNSLMTESAQGTAFIISLAQHYILTCSHLVEGMGEFTFCINDLNFETPARIVWSDALCDMALLQVGALPEQARFLSIYHGDKPVGKTTEITLAGYPLGEQVSRNLMVNTGRITNYESQKQNNERLFDTYMSDINATHGNSGGPVILQSSFEVIGLLQGGFEQVEVRLITDIRQLYRHIHVNQESQELINSNSQNTRS